MSTQAKNKNIAVAPQEPTVPVERITDCLMRIKTLAESVKLFLDSDEEGAGGSANAKAFALADMICAEADQMMKGGAA